MLTYNMDVTPESVWKRTTPSEAELAQSYYCTEAGVFYAQQHFSTARTDKESYLLFYTLRGAGLIEQGESHVVLSTGQALLLNCRTPQSLLYCTAPKLLASLLGSSGWYRGRCYGAAIVSSQKIDPGAAHRGQDAGIF